MVIITLIITIQGDSMVWDAASTSIFLDIAGVYSLPGHCWAILTIHPSPSTNAMEMESCPEGYGYAWSILAPGAGPKARGHRVAGVDNSDDSEVRAEIRANPKLSRHRAHRHYPDWTEVIAVNGEDWPVAGKGKQLPIPPASPEDFWDVCMACLKETLQFLDLPVPSQTELFATRVTEQVFRNMQKKLKQSTPDSGPTLSM